jgi:hypothetical protein
MWEREISRRIFGRVKEGGVWGIGTNQELINMCGETNYLRNQKRKVKIVRKYRKNVRRSNCEVSV